MHGRGVCVLHHSTHDRAASFLPLPLHQMQRTQECSTVAHTFQYLDEAVEQIGAILDIDVDVREQLAKANEDLVEVRQDVSSGHLHATESKPQKDRNQKQPQNRYQQHRNRKARAIWYSKSDNLRVWRSGRGKG